MVDFIAQKGLQFLGKQQNHQAEMAGLEKNEDKAAELGRQVAQMTIHVAHLENLV